MSRSKQHRCRCCWCWPITIAIFAWSSSTSAFVRSPPLGRPIQQQIWHGGNTHHTNTPKSFVRSLPNEDSESEGSSNTWPKILETTIASDPQRSTLFSTAMVASGAVLGPFLDAYHSAFGVLQYDEPFRANLWGSPEYPALTTTWWVPPLFGLAGFIIGWLYILLDAVATTETTGSVTTNKSAISASQRQSTTPQPSGFTILVGISFFTLQYWLSGILYNSGLVDRTSILNLMSVLAALGFVALDQTWAGFVTSSATALGGPLIEMGILRLSQLHLIPGGYHYNDLGETGFFPLWIVPVYFLGGPAVGNLARGIWTSLTPAPANVATPIQRTSDPPGCQVCSDTRCVPCPNCDGVGEYAAMGNRFVKCTSCRSRGFVICRSCFSYYDEDPNDIEAIPEKMSQMPD